MKRFFQLILGISIIFFFQQSSFGADTYKIGVIDVQKLEKDSVAFQKKRAEVKKKFDALQKKLDAEKAELLKMEEDLNKQEMMLSLDAKEDKRRELEKKKRHYKYIYDDYTQEMKDLQVETTREIGKDLEKVVKKIGEGEGYILILEKRTVGLVYYKDEIDITDQVTKAYDKLKQQ